MFSSLFNLSLYAAHCLVFQPSPLHLSDITMVIDT